jgi:hypothetical protein
VLRGELTVIWDLAAAINVGSWPVIMVLELGQVWDPGEDDGFWSRGIISSLCPFPAGGSMPVFRSRCLLER